MRCKHNTAHVNTGNSIGDFEVKTLPLPKELYCLQCSYSNLVSVLVPELLNKHAVTAVMACPECSGTRNITKEELVEDLKEEHKRIEDLLKELRG